MVFFLLNCLSLHEQKIILALIEIELARVVDDQLFSQELFSSSMQAFEKTTFRPPIILKLWQLSLDRYADQHLIDDETYKRWQMMLKQNVEHNENSDDHAGLESVFKQLHNIDNGIIDEQAKEDVTLFHFFI